MEDSETESMNINFISSTCIDLTMMTTGAAEDLMTNDEWPYHVAEAAVLLLFFV